MNWKVHIIVTVYITVHKFTLNMRLICVAVYGLVMSRSNSTEPRQKAIWVTFRVAIWMFDTACLLTQWYSTTAWYMQLQKRALYIPAFRGPVRKTKNWSSHFFFQSIGEISERLQARFPGVWGFSIRSVSIFCQEKGIHKTSRLSQAEVEHVVAEGVAKVFWKSYYAASRVPVILLSV